MPPERMSYQPNTTDTGAGVLDVPPLFVQRTAERQAGNALAADAYKDSVAFIKTFDGKLPNGQDATTAGTGFFVRKDGLLATDYHVIKDNKGIITVTTGDGVVHRAVVKKVDPGHDLALLQVQPALPGESFVPIELAQSSTGIKPNDKFMTRGYPHRSQTSHISEGTNNEQSPLSPKYKPVDGFLPGEDPNRRVIKSDAEIETGNSGGPWINKADGKAYGIVDFSTVDGKAAVVTPVEDLNNLIASLQDVGQPRFTPAVVTERITPRFEVPSVGGRIDWTRLPGYGPATDRTSAPNSVPSAQPVTDSLVNLPTLPRRR